MSKSKLEEWAYELDPDYPRDGTLEAIQVQTHRELMRKRSTHGALWLLERAREWCEKSRIRSDHVSGWDLFKHLEQLCGKEVSHE